MSWLNNQIAKIAPAFALKREIAQRRLKRLENFKETAGRRSFEAIEASRLRYDFVGSNKSTDAAIKGNLDTLRQHIRHLEFNTGFVSGPIRRIVRNVVASGIRFQSRVTADDDKLFFPAINKALNMHGATGLEGKVVSIDGLDPALMQALGAGYVEGFDLAKVAKNRAHKILEDRE